MTEYTRERTRSIGRWALVFGCLLMGSCLKPVDTGSDMGPDNGTGATICIFEDPSSIFDGNCTFGE